jgi:1-acyl-sn-glycerol-3-phosphate acyltransferase
MTDPTAYELPGGAHTFTSRVTYWVLSSLAASFGRVYFRVYARNKDAMPDGAVIVAPVHRSNLDVPLLGATSPRRLRYLAKGSLFETRFWAWMITTLGGFPLDRGTMADRSALKAALAVLERGEALAVFPEGERKSGPEVHPMADGAVWLSARSGAPILPVGIGGSERALPKGANVPRPTTITYLYGDLIPAPSNADGSRLSRRQLSAASGALHTTLQALFDEAQDLAGSPNPSRTS